MTHDLEVPRHPIGVAAERTGLSADVIRVWERRYGVVEPARDDGGQRLYTDADVERLRLLRRATDGGRSIGRVAELSPEALAELVRGDEEARAELRGRGEGPEAADVDRLVELAKALDGEKLEAELRRSWAARGLVDFAEGVAAPLLRRLGDGWHAGEVTPAQEHVASMAVRRVLEGARSGGAGEGAPVAVVGTLTGERHETGALMAAAAAALAGWRVVYLGPDLPPEELAGAVRRTGAAAVCASVVYVESRERVVEGFRKLRAGVPDGVEVYAGGGRLGELAEALEGIGVRCPEDVAGLGRALARQAAGG